MFNWTTWTHDLYWLKANTILLTRHGSHAYGTNTPTSDEDFKGIAIPPEEYFLGFHNRFEQAESHNPDISIYDIRKFFQLAADCNPNIIEILWTDPKDYVVINKYIMEDLYYYKHDFLSQKVKHTFTGYAVAQLKRIKTHREWLLNPPDHKPTRQEFNLPESSLISKDILGAIKALEDKGVDPANDERFSANIMTVYHQERAYHNALTRWSQYENWKKTRNPVRAELEAKYGYDCKHAMHLVRLLRMCREILTTGEVLVKRPDAKELLEIRNGSWPYEKILEFAEQEDAELGDLAKKSSLPHSPDRENLNDLCMELVKKFHSLYD